VQKSSSYSGFIDFGQIQYFKPVNCFTISFSRRKIQFKSLSRQYSPTVVNALQHTQIKKIALRNILDNLNVYGEASKSVV
jgi:hypothetical protein